MFRTLDLPVLTVLPTAAPAPAATPGPKPPWLKMRLPTGPTVANLRQSLRERGLYTVCEEARCPNLGECWADEPAKVARYAEVPGLKYLVLTSVDRDDLPDLGAGHYAATIRALKTTRVGLLVEALTPDFQGRDACVNEIVDAGVDVFAHNIETVERLHRRVRDARATYAQTLHALRAA
jgi:lipoic acid synthetase